jgi:triosephosphate isomerase
VKPEDVVGVVVAYEPVWAIGTGEVATPADAQEMAAAIRTKLAELYSADAAARVRVLYGGSVKASNVGPIMEGADVDGALVGGASLDAEEFVAMQVRPIGRDSSDESWDGATRHATVCYEHLAAR